MIDEKKLIEDIKNTFSDSVLNQTFGFGKYTFLEAIEEMINRQPQVETDTNVGSKWIPCEVEMPKEHESMFAKFKGTNKWSGGMFEKTSDEVNVTIELDDGSIITRTTHTIDGKWSVEINSWVKQKVIAWQPLPAPYKKEGAE